MTNPQKQAQNCPLFGSCPWPNNCNVYGHGNHPRLCDRVGLDRPGNPVSVRPPNPATGASAPKRGCMSFRYLVFLAIVAGAFLSLAIAWSL